jgi:hypothetical protein
MSSWFQIHGNDLMVNIVVLEGLAKELKELSEERSISKNTRYQLESKADTCARMASNLIVWRTLGEIDTRLERRSNPLTEPPWYEVRVSYEGKQFSRRFYDGSVARDSYECALTRMQIIRDHIVEEDEAFVSLTYYNGITSERLIEEAQVKGGVKVVEHTVD